MSDFSLPFLKGLSHTPAPNLPTEQLKDADIGPHMYVLALSQIRKAEILRQEKKFDTRPGYVTGGPDGRDVAVTMPSKEVFPIPARIFYGAYEVLGRVGDRLIARRHIQVRIAWEIHSRHGEFTWSDGSVTKVTRGDWLYQSDDDDFGTIQEDGQKTGYIKVGRIEKIKGLPWAQHFERLAWALTFLPPALIAIALLAIGLAAEHFELLASILTVLETLLLTLGAGAYLWARFRRWELKAALNTCDETTSRFQVAAELLGEKASANFPLMSLSRAAQAGASSGEVPVYSADNERKLQTLRTELRHIIGDITDKIERSRSIEERGTTWAGIAAAAVILSNILLIALGHALWLALSTLWLPSLIGAFHALSHRKRALDQVPLLQHFQTQMEFIEAELLRLEKWVADEPEQNRQEREAALRLLCKVLCQYSQSELRLAISQLPELPV